MDFIADILLIAAALGAGIYCHVLSRRLVQLNDLKQGVGGAVAVLSAQVDELKTALEKADASANMSVRTLGDVNDRAERAARRLELLLASMHDLPENETSTRGAFFTRHPNAS